MPGFVEYQRSQVSFPSRRIRQRRRRLVVVPLLFFIILIIVFYTLGSESRTRARNVRNYLSQTNDLVSKSNKIGQDFMALVENPSAKSRKLLIRRLSKYIKESEGLKEKRKEIKPPKGLREAHTYLKISLDLRNRGLRSFKSALLNALESKDLEVSSGQVSRALKDMALSDKAYEYFKSRAEQVVKESKAQTKVTKSQFIKDPLVYEKSRVMRFLAKLRGMEGLKGRHELRIVNISTDPKQVGYNSENEIAILPKTTSMEIIITVENQGNDEEGDIKVAVELVSEDEPVPQRNEESIKSIVPGTEEVLVLSGFKPTPDSLNLIKVDVDPVPGEKDTENNTQEYKFILRE